MRKLKRFLAVVGIGTLLAFQMPFGSLAAETKSQQPVKIESDSMDLQYMQDGGLFDPVYYAKKNQDVVAAYNSADKNILYQHYLSAGQAEGRLPYELSEDDKKNVKIQPFTPDMLTVPNATDYAGIQYFGTSFFSDLYVQFQATADNGLLSLGKQQVKFTFDHCLPYNSPCKVYYSEDGLERIMVTEHMVLWKMLKSEGSGTIWLAKSTDSGLLD